MIKLGHGFLLCETCAVTIPLALSLRFPACAAAVCALAVANVHAATMQVAIGGDPITPGSPSDMVLGGNEMPLPGVSALIEGLADEEVILGAEAWVSTLPDGAMRWAAQGFVITLWARTDTAGMIHYLDMLASQEGDTRFTGGESSERIAHILRETLI